MQLTYANQLRLSFLTQVGTEHLLIGLIVEENSKQGYLNTGLSAERARVASTERAGPVGVKGKGSASEVPFSSGAKRVFEAALEVRSTSCTITHALHIILNLWASEDSATTTIL